MKIVFIFIFHINILKLLKNILKNINLIFYFKKIKKTKVTHTKKPCVFAVQKYFLKIKFFNIFKLFVYNDNKNKFYNLNQFRYRTDSRDCTGFKSLWRLWALKREGVMSQKQR